MGKALAKGTILGAIIFYIWMVISWMVIPWHCSTLKNFQSEEAVSAVLMQNAPQSGVYVLPNFCNIKGKEKEEKSKATEKGPFIFTSILREGYPYNSPIPYIISFIIQLICAFFITYLVWQAKDLSYWNRVWFVTIIGLTIGVMEMSNWNWLGFSFGYSFLHLVDSVIGWFLAGLAIAAVTRRLAST